MKVMAIGVVEFSRERYIIRKVLAIWVVKLPTEEYKIIFSKKGHHLLWSMLDHFGSLFGTPFERYMMYHVPFKRGSKRGSKMIQHGP